MGHSGDLPQPLASLNKDVSLASGELIRLILMGFSCVCCVRVCFFVCVCVCLYLSVFNTTVRIWVCLRQMDPHDMVRASLVFECACVFVCLRTYLFLLVCFCKWVCVFVHLIRCQMAVCFIFGCVSLCFFCTWVCVYNCVCVFSFTVHAYVCVWVCTCVCLLLQVGWSMTS